MKFTLIHIMLRKFTLPTKHVPYMGNKHQCDECVVKIITLFLEKIL